jgi:hypothetical protein
MLRLIILVLFCFCRAATSFEAVASTTRTVFRSQNESIIMKLHATGGGNEDVVTEHGELDELSRPSISFTRNSILFDEDAPTQRDNGPLRVWRQAKLLLPALVTGAWGAEDGKGDRKPVEHLYNMVFIRIPTVLMAVVYSKNLLDGHGLILSFGGSFEEVPPIIVFAVFAIILR